MINATMSNSPVRFLTAKAELYSSSANAIEIAHTGNLKEFTVDRAGASKFFGFGICTKANIKVRDINREYDINTSNYFKLYIDNLGFTPFLYVTEVNRDENTNELSITVYDALHKASAHTVAELNLDTYTIGEFVEACAELLGLEAELPDLLEFGLSYETGANFEGTETIREVLDAAAEATQTIYYINAENKLVFKRLDKDGEAVFTIAKSEYFTLDCKTNRRLAGIANTTELGDNLSTTLEQSGTTQYIRNNPFWDLREDRAQLVDNALAAVGGLTINQFSCSWRGNYLLEPCDKLALVTKDDDILYSYLLSDTIKYDGGMTQQTEWQYEETEETESNPTNLGEVINQTFAKVDKQKKQIDLVASKSDANSSAISALQINTESISASVSSVETRVSESLNGMSGAIEELTKKVNATMTDEEINIAIESKLSDGAASVETTTGFKLNDEGLTISKSNSEISTTITENGMTVKKGNDDVLTANKEGVRAIDLHAETYLLIGKNSRFEDYDNDTRTGCFWIGG